MAFRKTEEYDKIVTSADFHGFAYVYMPDQK